MSVISALSIYWRRLAGSATAFSLQERVFHFVCLVTILALGYNIPLNYFVGLPLIAFVTFIILVMVLSFYLLSRFLQKTTLAITLFCITATIVFILNFFLNSGIAGPTDLFFIAAIIIVMVIAPARQHWFWVSINCIVVVSLHIYQYNHQAAVPYTYKTLADHYVDVTSAYFTVLTVVIISIYYFRRNYILEKKSSDQKAEVMKVLNNEKNKLLSIISHDLRAPLSNIQNYLEMLTLVDFSEEERMEIKKQLLQSTRSTLDMLDNVLSWSKSQMEGVPDKLTSINIANLLSTQLSLFINMAGSKKIRLQISIEPDLDVTGNGDMILLIVRNLVNNAIKFTSPGGNIFFTAERHLRSCLLTVKDSGNGKPVRLSNDIFYLNAESTAGTGNEKGVGLGLVLCKEFTELQHGTIRFENDPLSGTSFFVALPLANHKYSPYQKAIS